MTILHVLAGPAPEVEAEFAPLIAALAHAGLDQACALYPACPSASRLRAAGVQLTVQPFGGLFDLRTAPALATFARAVHARVVVQWRAADQRYLPKGNWARLARCGARAELKPFAGADYLVFPDKAALVAAISAGWAATRALIIPKFQAFAAVGDEALDKSALEAEEHALQLWRGLMSRFGEV